MTPEAEATRRAMLDRLLSRTDSSDLAAARAKIEAMDIELKEVVATLRDFRAFVTGNATQWKLGSHRHHQMWTRVADLLHRYGMNR